MAPNYYPTQDDDETKRVSTTLRIPPTQHEDLKMMVELWNRMDDALGKSRRKRWKLSTVMERLVAVGIDGFWEQVGGRPPTKEGREAFIRAAIQKITARK